MLLLITLMLGCPEPSATSASVAVGRVLDPAGQPLEELEVNSIEGRDWTDEEGRFVVEWQEPNQHVDLRWRGTTWRRKYRPADDGAVMTLRLPPVSEATVHCLRTAPCDLRLDWDLGGGLHGLVTGKCTDGETLELEAVPQPAPEAACMPTDAPDEVPAPVAVRADGWAVLDPLAPVRVEVRFEGETPPDECGVAVGQEVAEPSGDGFWVAEASGPVTVAAVCDGRPALPERVRVRGEPVSVALDWTPMGPEVDLSRWTRLDGAMSLSAVDGEGDGWSLHLLPEAEGTVLLPPLPPGLYQIRMGGVDTEEPPGDLPSGVVHVTSLDLATDSTVTGLAGWLSIEEDTTEGRIRLELAPQAAGPTE